jgi:hypothetical protein
MAADRHRGSGFAWWSSVGSGQVRETAGCVGINERRELKRLGGLAAAGWPSATWRGLQAADEMSGWPSSKASVWCRQTRSPQTPTEMADGRKKKIVWGTSAGRG